MSLRDETTPRCRGEAPPEESPGSFPYANWGAGAAVLGVVLALGAGILLGVPIVIVDSPGEGDLSTPANVGVQLATALAFLLVPLALAARWGASTPAEMLRRLGARGFRAGTALKWSAAAIAAYLVFAAVYAGIFGVPEQEDIAEGFGPLPVQILLIAIMAPISEELCFRGMLFGGLRRRYPRLSAALLSALLFGGLHVVTGPEAVPPLIAFGFILCLLYERTGSIVPGIVLHMLNNSVALIGQ